jgi:copper transport protein
VVVAGLVLGAVLAAAAPVQSAGAHATLVGSDPAADSVVSIAPEVVRLRFDEPVSPVPGGLRVLDPDGVEVGDGEAEVSPDGLVVEQAVGIGAVRGSFTVTYRVLSADGHVVGGSFVFSVGERSATARVEDGGDPASRFLDVLGRWLAACGSLLALGVVLLASLDPLGPLGVGLVERRNVLAGGAVAVLVGVAVSMLGVAGAYAGGLGAAPSVVGDVAVASASGTVAALRLATAALLVVLVAVPAAVRRAGPLLAAVVVLCLVLPALGGHAASADAPALAAVIGSLHLLAAGLWIGTIGVLAVRWRADRPLLGEFSQVAVVAAPLVVLTGLAGAWSQVDAVAQLWTSAYGQLLVVKAVFAAVLLLLGWLNRRQLTDATRALVDLAASVRLEAGLGLMVVAVSAVLVVTPPPGPLVAPVAVRGEAGDLVVDLELAPAAAGPNTVDLRYSNAAGTPVAVDATDVRVSTAGVEPRRLDVEAVGPSSARADDVVLTPGRWRFRVTVVRRGSPAVVELEVPVS